MIAAALAALGAAAALAVVALAGGPFTALALAALILTAPRRR